MTCEWCKADVDPNQEVAFVAYDIHNPTGVYHKECKTAMAMYDRLNPPTWSLEEFYSSPGLEVRAVNKFIISRKV